ncbi:MAG: transporter [Candidatus Limivivens sp.]|nr:transporter [Candidatus Limivivens sp.]
MKLKRPSVSWKVFLALHLSLLISSLGGVASKMAARQPFLSLAFCFYYGLVLVIMLGYAFIWQQILHYLPLTFAYSNKGVSLVWGMIWGALFFQETITWNMILGAGIIFFGIYLVVTSDE